MFVQHTPRRRPRQPRDRAAPLRVLSRRENLDSGVCPACAVRTRGAHFWGHEVRAGVIRHWCRAAIAGLSALSVVAVMLGGVADTAGPVTSSRLLRYPYLTDATAGAALVNFATDAASPAPVVTFGPAGGTCATSVATATGTAITVNAKSETQFKAQLTGLSANSSYCYRVLQNGVDLLGSDPSPSFTSATAPGDSTPYSFAVVGDWGAGTPDEANVLSRIASSPAKFVVTVGDNAYNSGTQTDYGHLLRGNVFPPHSWKGVGATRPVYAAQGNHGFTTHLPYLQNFPEPSVVQASGGRLQQESYCCIPPMASNHTYASAWYAFDWGSARYYVLEAAWADSQGGYAGDFYAHWNAPVPGCPACGTELQWLKADLAAHANTAFKFAFFHYPLYSDSPSQSSDTYLQGPNRLEGLLAKNNVNIVFNGHAHNYERNRPQIPGSPMVSYITGGGGDALGSIGCSAFDAYAVGSGRSCNAPAPTSSAQVFHFLLVTVSGNTVTVTPTDSTGRTFDVQSYTTNAARGTKIDSGPTPLTRATTATFTFHSTVAGATFACTLDAGAASPCSSPATFNGLAPGSHTLTIATTAPSGSNPAPASSTWTVDTSPPSIPAGVTANAVSGTKVNVSWAASTDDTGVTGYDVLRDGAAVGSVAGTTTTFSDTTASPSTTYQYTVDARDGAGNVSVASTPATVTTPVQTTITPALVQWAGSTSKTVTFPATTTAGNLLVLSAGVSTGVSQPITAVSDGKNTWTKIGAFAVSGKVSDGEMWYTANAASVGSVTVTTGAAGVALLAQEFSGVATTSPLDVSGGAANTSTAASSGAVTPTATNDLAVGFAAGHGSTQAMNVTAHRYATQAQQNNTANTTSVVAGYQALTSSAAQTFTAGFGSAMYWAAGIATFKASSTPPPPPPNDFSMAANPNAVTVTAGQSGTSSITTTLTSGAAQNIALSATGLPAGANASFNPATIGSGQSSTMTISTTTATPAASSTITITGTGTTATHTTSLTLTVSAPVADDFSMAASPNTVTVTAAQSGTSSITTTLTSGAAQNTPLSATGLPAGASASFNPATVGSGQSSTMTITTKTATPPASSTITITGTGTT